MESLLQDICRLCANEKPKVSVNMFSDIGKRHQLPDKIRLCLPVSIDEDDRLPKEICVTCLNKLDVCNELYHTSFTAQNILKSKLECLLGDQKQSKKELSQSNGGNQLNNDNTKLNPQQPASNVTSLGTTFDLIPTKEQLNSSVISTDVVIRLTSLEPQNVNPPKVINFFTPTKEVEVESQTPGIVVTDITGVPLGPLPNDDDDQNMFEADSYNHLSDNEETDKPPDSSERLSSSNVSESKDDKKNDVHVRKFSQHKTNGSKQQKLSDDRNGVNVSKVKSGLNRGKESSSGMVKCKYCAKKFLKYIIDHHERLHLKERVYSCVDCGKDFCTEIGLSVHKCGKS